VNVGKRGEGGEARRGGPKRRSRSFPSIETDADKYGTVSDREKVDVQPPVVVDRREKCDFIRSKNAKGKADFARSQRFCCSPGRKMTPRLSLSGGLLLPRNIP